MKTTKTCLAALSLFLLCGRAYGESQFMILTREADAERVVARRLALRHQALKVWRKSDGSRTLAMTFTDMSAIYFSQGKPRNALQFGDKALKLDKNNLQAYINRGLGYLGTHRYHKAIRDFRKGAKMTAAQKNPDPQIVYAVHLNLCAAYVYWGDFAKADPHCRLAVKRAEHRPESHVNLSLLFAGRGEHKKAFRELKKASSAMKNLVTSRVMAARGASWAMRSMIYTAKGKIYLAQGRRKKAANLFGMALAKLRRSAPALKGKALARSDSPKAAIKLLNKALRSDPDYLEAYMERGTLHARAGRDESAEEDFAKALGIAPLPEAYYRRALYHMDRKRFKEADADLAAALKRLPDYPAARKAREKVRRALGG